MCPFSYTENFGFLWMLLIILIFCPQYWLLKYKILFPPLSYFLKVEFLVFLFFIHIVFISNVHIQSFFFFSFVNCSIVRLKRFFQLKIVFLFKSPDCYKHGTISIPVSFPQTHQLWTFCRFTLCLFSDPFKALLG